MKINILLFNFSLCLSWCTPTLRPDSITLSGGAWWAWASWRTRGQRNRRGPWASRTTWRAWETGLSCKFILLSKLAVKTDLKLHLLKSWAVNRKWYLYWHSDPTQKKHTLAQSRKKVDLNDRSGIFSLLNNLFLTGLVMQEPRRNWK